MNRRAALLVFLLLFSLPFTVSSASGVFTVDLPHELDLCGDSATLIHQIQGSGNVSPEVGNEHVLEGVVSGDFQGLSNGLGGFYLQEETDDMDTDPLTSEGIFVFEGSSTLGVEVSTGDVVRLQGTVAERFNQTALIDITAIVVCGVSTLQPTSIILPMSSLDNWENYEGMLVTFPQILVVSEHYNLGRYGEVELSALERLYAPTTIAVPGSAALAQQSANDLLRIQLDDGSLQQNPPTVPYLGSDNTLRIGDSTTGLSGILGYNFGEYEIHPIDPVSFSRSNPRPAFPEIVERGTRIASFNVYNYFTTLGSRGANTPEEFQRQRDKIFPVILSLNADILGIIELENNSTEAIANLVDGVNQAAGSALYDYVDTGVLGTQDIRVGLIYQPGRVSPIGDFAVLDSTYEADFRDTYNRPALAQTFQDSFGERLTVVVNHLKSKGSSCAEIGDPDMNDGQGNCNLTRTQAVEVLTQWLASDPTNSGDADFLILGDLNAYAMEDPVRVLNENGFTNLIDQYDVQPVYSYVFDGQSGVLDHAFASSSLVGKVRSADIWHINADEPRILDYNQEFNPVELYQPDAFRSSDHDPIVVTIMPAGATEVFFPLTTR